MDRDQIVASVLEIMKRRFEMDSPGLDDNLREVHGFDSIDGLVLLEEVQNLVGFTLSQDQKKAAMGVRTIRTICEYVEALERSGPAPKAP